MKAISKSVIQILLVTVLFSCNNSTKKPDSADTKIVTPADSSKTIAENKNTADTSNERPKQLKAMFVEFTLGDAQHFMFKDESGKAWDFAANEDTLSKFAVELPKNKSNETNQGWGSDKALQGKWFNLTYVNRNQPQYEGGPMINVPVILTVKKAD
jgi:hypothetical protein